jgi:hypothetical protein
MLPSGTGTGVAGPRGAPAASKACIHATDSKHPRSPCARPHTARAPPRPSVSVAWQALTGKLSRGPRSRAKAASKRSRRSRAMARCTEPVHAMEPGVPRPMSRTTGAAGSSR